MVQVLEFEKEGPDPAQRGWGRRAAEKASCGGCGLLRAVLVRPPTETIQGAVVAGPF